ncbi:hypothetical protein ACH3VR_11790 [Microbacterium sp. B2969]|uniref:Uncharacterized protein n=1 Tax=Microbacterium alkaliflavum TaxID=3248839 RepID=A0ABW7Q8R4_9MICO
MADLLQREYNLPVIRVTTTQKHAGALVTVAAVLNRYGEQIVVRSVDVPLTRFGLGRASTRRLQVPPEVIDLLAPRDAARGRDWPQADPQWEAWLHLVKPYGLLGAIPWERDLTTRLGRPIARLPDVLPSPQPPHDRFLVGVLADAPGVGAKAIMKLADALVRGVGRRLKVLVVVTSEGRRRLEDELAASGVDHELRIIRRGRSSASVLDLAADALAGQALDGVHFIMRATTLNTHGALVSHKIERSPLMPFGDVASFLTRLGAPLASFSRPPGLWDDFGLRLLVDSLGSNRAGPVLLHDPAAEPGGESLSKVYEILSGAVDGRLVPSPAQTVFIQPAALEPDDFSAKLVTQNTWVGAEGSVLPAAEPPVLRAVLDPAPVGVDAVTPQWWAAAQRFLEQRNTDLTRFQTSSSMRGLTDVEEARFSGAKRGLADASAILEDFLRSER